MIRRLACVALLGAVLAAASACSGSDDGGGSDGGSDAGAPAAGSSAVPQGRWWAWAAAEAEGRDPVSDGSGEHCARNQPAEVWFLAGTFGGLAERVCTVPAGRPLVAPAVNRFSESAADCAEFMAGAAGEITVDGTAVTLDRIEAERVEFTGVADNAMGTGTDRIRATACGLWARIPALAAGRHVVHIRGTAGTFTTEAEYTITV